MTQQHTPTQRFEGDIIGINDKCFVLRYTNFHKPPYFSPKLLYECSKTIIACEDCIFLLELSKVLLLLTSICKLTFKAFNLSPLQSVETTKLISTVEPELGKTKFALSKTASYIHLTKMNIQFHIFLPSLQKTSLQADSCN